MHGAVVQGSDIEGRWLDVSKAVIYGCHSEPLRMPDLPSAPTSFDAIAFPLHSCHGLIDAFGRGWLVHGFSVRG